MLQEQKKRLIELAQQLHERAELAKTMTSSYFEPGKMEYPEQYEGVFDEANGTLLLRFEVKGTRYDGRTEQIEKVHLGDVLQIVRDEENEFNHNNFNLMTLTGKDVGNMPAEICDVLAPIYDNQELSFESVSVSYVEPISRRSRHAKQAILFVELKACIRKAITEESLKPVAYKGDGKFIFISYAHKDSKMVFPIIRKMQKCGFNVWYDEGIELGTSWDDYLADNILDCECMISFVSANYLNSVNCHNELDFAKDENKNILMAYLENVRLPSGMRMRLGHLQAAHYYAEEEERFYEKLFSSELIQNARD